MFIILYSPQACIGRKTATSQSFLNHPSLPLPSPKMLTLGAIFPWKKGRHHPTASTGRWHLPPQRTHHHHPTHLPQNGRRRTQQVVYRESLPSSRHRDQKSFCFFCRNTAVVEGWGMGSTGRPCIHSWVETNGQAWGHKMLGKNSPSSSPCSVGGVALGVWVGRKAGMW